jgi:hypothetical protein
MARNANDIAASAAIGAVPLATRFAALIRPWLHPRTAPVLIGATIPSASILWVHAENYSRHAYIYSVQPPSVSRSLIDPAIAQPFEWMMILGAAFLAIAVTQVARGMAFIMHQANETRRSSWQLLRAWIYCEAMAIAGMIVLSQFTGDAHAQIHDAGSYMLFFGHAFAITGLGMLIRRLLRSPNAPSSVALLSGQPAHALVVAWLSAAFGTAYFWGKLWPDDSVFTQHLAFSLLEMLALLAFLSFLARFHRFLAAVNR